LAAGGFWTTVALRDLARAQAWLTQPGSGRRAHQAIRRIKAATDALTTTAGQYAADPDRPANRGMIVAGHVVSFRLVPDEARSLVFVERVLGPGQSHAPPTPTPHRTP